MPFHVTYLGGSFRAPAHIYRNVTKKRYQGEKIILGRKAKKTLSGTSSHDAEYITKGLRPWRVNLF